MKSSVSRQAVFAFLFAAAAVTASSRVSAQPEPDAGVNLDPSSPLDAMPDVGLDWPDPSEPEGVSDKPVILAPGQPVVSSAVPPVEMPEIARTQAEASFEQRYSITIDGLEGLDASGLRTKFDALSTLKQGQGAPANTAQIDRRAREDEKLLRELMRAEGYYAASVNTRVDPDGARLGVRLVVEPGQLYHVSDIEMQGIALAGDQAASAVEAFGIRQGDAAKAEKILEGTDKLRKQLLDHGFPFVKVGEPNVIIDHGTRTAALNLTVDPGTAARFGQIELRGAKQPFSTKHVGRIARFKAGDVYNDADLEDLRRALIATGLVSSVSLTPVRTADPAIVNVAVAVERAPRRTVAGELGYGTGEGFRTAVSWTHRNLIRPEGAVTFRGVAGTREQYLGASLRRSNFKRRDQVLTGQVAFSHVDRDAYDAKTFLLSGGLERQTNIIWQKKWTWSVLGELLVSDERDTIAATGEARRRTYYIAAAPSTLAYDGSDDLLNPTRGFRLAGRFSPEVSFRTGTLAYARVQLDSSVYQPVGGRTVIAARTRLGTIAGAHRDQIAPSRRFYSGGGGSVRGYGYQDIGPKDVDGTPIGGRSIAEFSLEARVRFGDFGVVPFIDAGNIYTSPLPRFTGMRYGAGIGARYYTNFGPIRVDVGTPLNRRPGDSRVAVYVSLGQAF